MASLAPNAPQCEMTQLVRALQKTVALRGVEILPGSSGIPSLTAPNRIVIWPADGTWVDPADRSVSISDVDQMVICECWAKGASSGQGNEATFADWNSARWLLVRLTRAMVEQGENPTDPSNPGLFWETVGVIGWNVGQDTTQQGTSIKAMFKVTATIPAASTDEGHVGENWDSGVAESVDITGAP